MESQVLAMPSKPHSKPTGNESKPALIREWITKLALNAGAAIDGKTLGVFEALWLEGFEDLPYSVLEAAFKKTLRKCKFWPVKVADIREHVAQANQTAIGEAAEEAWQQVLDVRRIYWNPDIPGPFDRAVARLSDRVRQAARAAGVFRDFDSLDALHTWAKKRFVESFIAWGELEQDKFLLPDGEIKNLLAGFAETKALPSSTPSFEELRQRGLEYAKQIAPSAKVDPRAYRAPQRVTVWDSPEEREQAFASLAQKETDPVLIDKIRSQKAALEARGAKLQSAGVSA